MVKAEFLSKANVYEGDYVCLLRNPDNEMLSRLHYHDFYEFVVYLGSAGTFQIKNGEYLVKRGDIVLIDIFTPHTLVNSKTDYYERFSVSIDPSLLIAFSTPESNLLDIFNESGKHHRIFHVENEDFEKYITLLNEYRNSYPKNGHDIWERALIHHLLSYIYSDCFVEAKHSQTDSNHLAIIAQLINYVNGHLSEELSLEQLSQLVNYSESYVCRLFKKLTNKTLISYIQEKRIEQAACLLKQGIPVNQAAEDVGFNNYSYFYKTFKKLKGCGPADYREQLQPSAK
jgi:YesN/AraC family two-component response regulator